MEFNFIVGKLLLKNGTEKNIGGFLELKKAQEYVETIHFDYLYSVAFFVDSPEGRYYFGEDRKGKKRWYSPEEREQVLVYDCSMDEIRELADVVIGKK
ncbi:hypothetical protein [Anaeromicropila populeti]|uniref:Uncharacterized protein n=1 Tax=Anaeromicropila populeti TaxID=37658 RepID=A0A1I6LWT5_9FIRM|nr:hypothetical protein [Anaeromicropila populeti]SFS07865.1 hypothetical protein SAMN05661086_03624 [Anaeromicropila populeti]